MAGYSLFIKESVQKDLQGIPKKDVRKILTRIKSLAHDPRPLDGEKLTGQDRYRLRQGRYRIVYAVQDREHAVTVVKVAHRKDVYRR
jgi:mRNA interferase RelE/StbE